VERPKKEFERYVRLVPGLVREEEEMRRGLLSRSFAGANRTEEIRIVRSLGSEFFDRHRQILLSSPAPILLSQDLRADYSAEAVAEEEPFEASFVS
jgi:hypothetical protein